MRDLTDEQRRDLCGSEGVKDLVIQSGMYAAAAQAMHGG